MQRNVPGFLDFRYRRVHIPRALRHFNAGFVGKVAEIRGQLPGANLVVPHQVQAVGFGKGIDNGLELLAHVQRGRIFGITDSIFMIVSVVGGPLGGLLAGRLGFKTLYLVAMVFYLLASVLRLRMAIQVRRAAPTAGQPLSLAGLRGKTQPPAAAGQAWSRDET